MLNESAPTSLVAASWLAELVRAVKLRGQPRLSLTAQEVAACFEDAHYFVHFDDEECLEMTLEALQVVVPDLERIDASDEQFEPAFLLGWTVSSCAEVVDRLGADLRDRLAQVIERWIAAQPDEERADPILEEDIRNHFCVGTREARVVLGRLRGT